MRCKLTLMFLAGLLPQICAAAPPDAIPDATAVRKIVDQLIKDRLDSKEKGTLGLVNQAAALSIAFGAPAWNAGDHEGCAQFYARTAESLCAAFSEDATATPATRKAIADLKAALDRNKDFKEADRKAWSLRYAFDKTQLTCTIEAERIQAMVEMGEEIFHRAQYPEALDAFRSAVDDLRELEGLESRPVACRYAPLGLANALFAQKRYADAADAIAVGLKFVPQWPAARQDLRGHWGDPADYEAAVTDLEAKVKATPGEASLQFVLAYQYHFTGRRALARSIFLKVLNLKPDHTGAMQFLEEGAPKKADEPPPLPRKSAEKV